MLRFLSELLFALLPALGNAAGRLADDRVWEAVFTVGGPSMTFPGAGLMMLGVAMVVACVRGRVILVSRFCRVIGLQMSYAGRSSLSGSQALEAVVVYDAGYSCSSNTGDGPA